MTGLIIDVFFKIILIIIGLFVGLVSLVGGLKGKSNPFFWIRNYNGIYLKTPKHYIIFGAVATLLFLFFLAYQLHLLGLF